jgi:hypothetical protein
LLLWAALEADLSADPGQLSTHRRRLCPKCSLVRRLLDTLPSRVQPLNQIAYEG